MISLTWKNSEEIEERNRVSSYRGYLLKLRRSKNLLAPQWGRRWLSIEGHFLKWYRTETDVFPSGMIDLKYIRSITKVENYGVPWTFMLTCEERNLILRCASHVEMMGWIRALHIQADIVRGGSGMMVVSDFNQVPLNSTVLRYGQKHRKSKSSLSLQQELDLTLRKLNELERELQRSESKEPEERRSSRPSDSVTYKSQREEEKAADDEEEAEERGRVGEEEDSVGSLSNLPVRMGKQAQNKDNREGDSESTKRGSILRTESLNSIEDISLNVAKPSRAKSSRQHALALNKAESSRKPSTFIDSNSGSPSTDAAYPQHYLVPSHVHQDEFDFEEVVPPASALHHAPTTSSKPPPKQCRKFDDFEIAADSIDYAEDAVVMRDLTPQHKMQLVRSSRAVVSPPGKPTSARRSIDDRSSKGHAGLKSAWSATETTLT